LFLCRSEKVINFRGRHLAIEICFRIRYGPFATTLALEAFLVTTVVAATIEYMRASKAYSHTFLSQLRSSPMNRRGAEGFAVQWYKAATAHKKAFPGLIYNMPDDRVRLQLIEILREEYGYGEETRVHANILRKFVLGLGLSVEAILSMPSVPGVSAFSHDVDEIWTRGDPIKAFGVHFALEFLAANMHKAFYAGVQTLGLGPDDIEYFQIHSVAEDQHSELAAEGMCYLAMNEANRECLREGVELGSQFVEMLLDGLYEAYRSQIN
jgi:pyrroloquinoline quinone (PQQ) biosynthesis protein C